MRVMRRLVNRKIIDIRMLTGCTFKTIQLLLKLSFHPFFWVSSDGRIVNVEQLNLMMAQNFTILTHFLKIEAILSFSNCFLQNFLQHRHRPKIDPANLRGHPHHLQNLRHPNNFFEAKFILKFDTKSDKFNNKKRIVSKGKICGVNAWSRLLVVLVIWR